jgi:hypothetical protein|tara:strand:+ start:284 stop:442 length:159 start_codon:yes stop_codon:yes gene_type:complete
MRIIPDFLEDAKDKKPTVKAAAAPEGESFFFLRPCSESAVAKNSPDTRLEVV